MAGGEDGDWRLSILVTTGGEEMVRMGGLAGGMGLGGSGFFPFLLVHLLHHRSSGGLLLVGQCGHTLLCVWTASQ